MKRIIGNLMIFTVLTIGLITGCTKDTGDMNSVAEESSIDTSILEKVEAIVEDVVNKENITDGVVNVEEQIKIIADNIDTWSIPDDMGVEMNAYVVADLDQNGRLEMISSVMGGSGLYTTSDIYEVNESMDGLTKVIWQKAEGDSEPDLQIDSCTVYYDSSNDIYSYIIDDILRAGMAQSLVTRRSFSLKYGSISDLLLASWVTEATGDGSEIKETYRNANQEDISRDDFDHIAENVNVGNKKGTATFSWLRYQAYDETTSIKQLTKEELISQLSSSYDGFSVNIY